MRASLSTAACRAALFLVLAAALPAWAQPAPPPVAAYAHPANMASPSLSPDGTHVAFLSPINGRQAIVIRKLRPAPGDKPAFVMPGDAEIKWITWVNPERLMAEAEEVEMVMGPSRRIPWRNTALFAFNRDGSDMLRLKVDDVAAFVDDRTILGFRDGDMVRLDIYRNRAEKVAGGTAKRVGFIPDPFGQVRLAVDYSDSTQSTIYLYREKPDDGFEVLWRSGKDSDYFEILGFSAEPDVVYAASNHEGDLSAVYAFNLKTRQFGEKVASHPRYDVEDAHVDKGRVLAFDWMEDLPARRWIDPATQSLQEALDKAVPDSREIIVDQTRDGRYTLVASYSPVEPRSYKLFDRQTKELSFFGDTYPKIPQDALGTRKAVSYKARDGLAITGYLTLPPGREPRSLPLVVMPHGGPIARDDLSFDLHAQFLASRGYAVFQPNFRGSSGYGAKFIAAGKGEWGAKMQDDINDGLAWVVEQGFADPKRVCIVGWSYGGYAALVGAMRDPGLFRCAIATAPVANLTRLYNELRWSFFKNLVRDAYFEQDKDRLRQVSPYHMADRLVIPLLIVHGDRDAQAYVQHSRDMVSALESAGKRFEYLEIEGMDHSPRTEAHHTKVLEAWDRFLKTHLPP